MAPVSTRPSLTKRSSIYTPTTWPNTTQFLVSPPGCSGGSSTVFQNLHSSAAGLSLTRGVLTRRPGTAVRSPTGVTATPEGKDDRVLILLQRQLHDVTH